MDEFDAYAPPKADTGTSAPKKKSKKKKAVSGAVAEAIERLNEHIQDADAMANDRREAGGRFRRPTIGFMIFCVFVVGGTAFVLNSNQSRNWDNVGTALVGFAAFFVVITAILVGVDLAFLPREKPASPEDTLKHFFKAISMARLGYAWSALCPTAREQSVEAPVLGPIPVGPGTFMLRRTSDLKDYTQTFARPGNGQMRTMQIKRLTLVAEAGDVAVVEVTAMFQAWPQWAQMIAVVCFVIIRALGAVVFLVLYFALRKNHEVVFRKTLIRGSNGLWYVYSADLLETNAPSL